MTMIDPARPEMIMLTRCESLLAAGEYPAAFAALRDLLVLHRKGMAREASAVTLGVSGFVRFSGRVMEVWLRLVQESSWDPLQDPALNGFLCELAEFYALAGACADNRLDQALAIRLAEFGKSRRPDDFLRVLLLWTPDSNSDFSPFEYFEYVRTVVVAQALAVIAMVVVCSPRAHGARNAALSFLNAGRVAANDLVPFARQPVFFSAWFRCSYASDPGKHDIKRLLNAAIESVLATGELTAPPALPAPVTQDTGDARPRMVIPLEWAFNEEGAMYRCYAPVLHDLRRSFYTIGMSERCAAPADSLFDQFFFFEDLCPHGAVDASVLAAAIRAMQPKAVFYPSVGMMRSVVLLANQRMAPVQAMTLGHPASSRSRHMDYVLVERGYVDDPAIFSEHFLPLADGALAFGVPAGNDDDFRDAQLDGEVVNIAVPAVAQKLSWPFLEALGQVAGLARRPLRFHFFTGLTGTSFLDVARRITAQLPGSVIYAYMEYRSYNEKVARCQIHAASFPFGGTNSLIDSLRHGIPVVALRGREVHEKVDFEFLRRLGLDDDLGADSVAEYVAILGRLVNDPDFLAVVREKLRNADVAGVLMGSGHPEAFSDALLALVSDSG